MNKLLLSITFLMAFIACQSSGKFVNRDVPNTPAAGFNTEGSDPKAIALADSVMKACGGRYAWDQTRYMRWTFFNNRMLVWDKKQNRVRIEFMKQDMKVLLNMDDMTGKVWKDGVALTEPDSIKKYLQRGKEAWINDSYWLVMPFKLKDSGVTLKYLGKRKNALDSECDVLELTFKSVGVTPDNKYNLYVNPSSKLIVQWDYFKKYSDEKPSMSTPWADYRGLGNIMLALNRGEGRFMTPMGVYKSIPDSAFTKFSVLDWSKIK
jgi:hypothetical protein